MKKGYFIGALVCAGLLAPGCAAHAHATSPRPPAVTATVNFHWAYVDAHWSHGRHVSGKWVRRPGSHPHAHRANHKWVPGHYVGHGPRRHYVPGHWSRR